MITMDSRSAFDSNEPECGQDLGASERHPNGVLGLEVPDHLTSRQRQVLELVAHGYKNAAIADRLSVSPKTVENYINTIYDAMHVHCNPIMEPRVVATLCYLGRDGRGRPKSVIPS